MPHAYALSCTVSLWPLPLLCHALSWYSWRPCDCFCALFIVHDHNWLCSFPAQINHLHSLHLPLTPNSSSIPPSIPPTTSLQSAMSNYTGFPNPSASLSSVSAHAHAASAQAQAAAAACSYSSMLPGAAGEHPGCHQNSCKSAIRRPNVKRSVCLSVCLFVCLSTVVW